jgi:hypothetical protein
VSSVRQPEPVKLIVGLLARDLELLALAVDRLGEVFGPIDERSQPAPFTYTRYYESELGEHPWRQFVTFVRLVDPGQLASIKTETNRMEQEWAQEGRRPVNLDPGYISLSKLVLATTKDYWHRVYLGQGIYAEATLPFRGGAFHPQEWTYPDYRAPEHLAFFLAARERYRGQLQSRRRGGRGAPGLPPTGP